MDDDRSGAKNAAIWVCVTRAMTRNVAFACVGEMTTRCESSWEMKKDEGGRKKEEGKRAKEKQDLFLPSSFVLLPFDSVSSEKRVSAVDDVVKAVLAGERRIVAVDVEATCWKKGVFSRKKETIEIGAVLLLIDRAESKWPEFQTFVRPMRLPRLSSFCRELTSITQENVDSAASFPEALRLFLDWLQPSERVVVATWSHYDLCSSISIWKLTGCLSSPSLSSM